MNVNYKWRILSVSSFLLYSILLINCFIFTACKKEIPKKEVKATNSRRAQRIEKIYQQMEREFEDVVLSENEKTYLLKYRNLMAPIPGGRVALGRNGAEISPTRKNAVRLEVDPFEIGSVEVTFSLYDIFCKSTNRPFVNDNGWGRDSRPVINVSWYDAIEFANWMSLASGLKPCYLVFKDKKDEGNLSLSDPVQWDLYWLKDANGYRLPTEIEWEFAAKGGSAVGSSIYSGSKELNSVAWTFDNSGRQTWPVATKSPNERSVYDMSGNVLEWCWDWYGDYPLASTLRKYSGVRSGATRILRGGSWYNSEKQFQTIHRSMGKPSFKSNRVGFRLARNIDE